MMKRVRMAAARHDTRVLLHQTAGPVGLCAGQRAGLRCAARHPTGNRPRTSPLLPEGPMVHVLCIDPLEEVEPHETLIRTGGFDLPVDIQCVPGMREAVRASESHEH